MSDVNETKPKTKKAQVFVWRNRNRGFLVIIAENVKTAREQIAAEYPTWMAWCTREPEIVLKPEVGQSAYIKQRLIR